MNLHVHFPILFQVVVLNYLSMRSALPYCSHFNNFWCEYSRSFPDSSDGYNSHFVQSGLQTKPEACTCWAMSIACIGFGENQKRVSYLQTRGRERQIEERRKIIASCRRWITSNICSSVHLSTSGKVHGIFIHCLRLSLQHSAHWTDGHNLAVRHKTGTN
jgi:hypothetical protein